MKNTYALFLTLFCLSYVGLGWSCDNLPSINITPYAMYFGNVPVGESYTQHLKVSVDQDLVLRSIKLTGTAPGDYALGKDIQLPLTIKASDGAVSIPIVYTPTSTTGGWTFLSMTFDDGAPNTTNTESVTTELYGQDGSQPGYTVSPAPIPLGSIYISNQASTGVTIVSNGQGPSDAIVSAKISGTDAAAFSYSGPGDAQSTLNGPVLFAPTFSLSGNLTASPVSTNASKASLDFVFAGGDAVSVPLSVQGLFQILAYPASIYLGTDPAGGTTRLRADLTLENEGSAQVTILDASIPSVPLPTTFSLAGFSSKTLPGLNSMNFSVVFDPSGLSSGTYTASVNIATSVGGLQVPVSAIVP